MKNPRKLWPSWGRERPTPSGLVAPFSVSSRSRSSSRISVVIALMGSEILRSFTSGTSMIGNFIV